jgi:hypothetical protein
MRTYRKSFRKAVFVVEDVGMIKVRTFDLSSHTLRDCSKFLKAGLGTAARQALEAFPQSFDHNMSQ